MTAFRPRLAALLAGAALTALPGTVRPSPTAAGSPPPATDIVAQVGNTTLTVGDLQIFLDHIDPATRQQLLRNRAALAELVRGQLVRQELLDQAKAKKWDQDPDVAYRAALAHDAVIVDSYLASLTQPDAAYPSDADVQAAYEANKARFMQPRAYRLAQIFLAMPPDAAKSADDDAQKKLRDLKQALSRPHNDFADSARHLSQDKVSAERGGETGWAREDQLLPAIKAAVAGLADNAVSDPVRAPDGWHLIKLLETKPAAPAALADVRDTIVRSLRQQKAAENARAYIQQMQSREPVELNEIVLAHVSAN